MPLSPHAVPSQDLSYTRVPCPCDLPRQVQALHAPWRSRIRFRQRVTRERRLGQLPLAPFGVHAVNAPSLRLGQLRQLHRLAVDKDRCRTKLYDRHAVLSTLISRPQAPLQLVLAIFWPSSPVNAKKCITNKVDCFLHIQKMTARKPNENLSAPKLHSLRPRDQRGKDRTAHDKSRVLPCARGATGGSKLALASRTVADGPRLPALRHGAAR